MYHFDHAETLIWSLAYFDRIFKFYNLQNMQWYVLKNFEKVKVFKMHAGFKSWITVSKQTLLSATLSVFYFGKESVYKIRPNFIVYFHK